MEHVARICYFGAAPDTGNLGVSALCFAVTQGLADRFDVASLTVFDHGRGIRPAPFLCDNPRVDAVLGGAIHSRRYYRRESYWNIRMAARLAGLGNPAARRIARASAILDVSGGDSFTDLYGEHRFQAIIQPKQLALHLNRPLVLLPQTYGPFRGESTRAIASEIVRRSSGAWARDQRSFQALQNLLGDDFDPSRHRCGVDVAFALRAVPPAVPLPDPLPAWLGDGAETETIGFNVSGLILNGGTAAVQRYGLKADYPRCVQELLTRILEQSDVNVVLVPHVNEELEHHESDLAACRKVIQHLPDRFADRVAILPPQDHPGRIKWLIGRTSWFCGTRMHSTIAGLSSGVPTASIAYSDKTLGVFETCGQGAHVADPRHLGKDEVLDQVWSSFQSRAATRASLAARLPAVLEQAQRQLDEIAVICRGEAPEAVAAVGTPA